MAELEMKELESLAQSTGVGVEVEKRVEVEK